MFPLDVETNPLPLTSKSPPNCGVVSSTTLEIAPEVANPATNVLLDIFFSPPPEVSTASSTSSLATVDISDKEPTAIELKLVPSAINKLPAVLVPIVMSSPVIVRSPAIVTFCEASIVKAVVPPVVIVITSEPLKAIELLVSASPTILSN